MDRFENLPSRGFILIFTPGPKASNMSSRGFLLIFSPGPKESNKKVLHEPLKMTISGPYVKVPPRRLKLIFTPDPAKQASLRLEIYSLRPF